MQILVVGGTGWLGGEVVRAALARGHDVATLARGVSGAPPAGVRALTADRDDAADVARALAGVRPDAVVDTSGYTVAGARTTASHLAGVGAYAYVSSLNAYRDWPGSPIRGVDDPVFGEPDDDPADYGPMKAASERVLARALDDRLLVVRSGLIAGPGDPTGRLGWWLRRMARGGPVVVPVDVWDQPVTFVDVRDLSGWMVESVECGRSGAVNATGDVGVTTFGRLLELCRDVVGDDARSPVTWAERDDATLLAAGVQRWVHLPFWVPADEARALWDIDTSSARRAGLPSRPIEETVTDLWAWLRGQPEALDDDAAPAGRTRPGLPDDVEQALLG
ncbi:NAD-dependent epimerase/dehydratase family protein [Cellulomonas sp. ATA003]|uniref:NAD-dependent epimerase/dehydratase family protein n=1 Tax=Cellulomonas sp. ATA003 TaxID=3073064 RepID=UPI0028737C97|nr:NAD-dependent epimerase/dehydratase family protein [Cellulomonas sp. ATA003]WNB86056.1 NAD-dependent epimerase/dehydratase family protein [Cellulomonas sp. ATA003]